ncbi:MAG TPA: hypothetical protein VH442_01750, partial [Micromonosporaceae bacterium]
MTDEPSEALVPSVGTRPTDADEWLAEALAWRDGTSGHVRASVLSPDPRLGLAGEDVDPTEPATFALAADLLATMA